MSHVHLYAHTPVVPGETCLRCARPYVRPRPGPGPQCPTNANSNNIGLVRGVHH